MKKFKSIRFFKILSLIAAFAVFLPSCSSSDDSNSGETENEKESSDNDKDNDNNSKNDDTDAIITLKLTSNDEKYYYDGSYAGVYKADTTEGELALCIGPFGNGIVWNSWYLYKKANDGTYSEYIYADNFSGKIENIPLKDYTQTYKVLNGTVNSDVTRYNEDVFDGKISKAAIEVSGSDCTLILKGKGTKKSVIDSISLENSIFSISQITSGQTVSATVSGSNLDIAESIVLQIYDSTGNAAGESIKANVTNSSELSINIPLPEKPGEYKIKASGTSFGKTTDLKIYGDPLFTSVSIPKVGVSKAGNTVTATIKGKNFTSPLVSSDSFSFSCDNNSVISGTSVTIKDDNTLKATFTIPSDEGIFNVIISTGANSISGEFEVENYTDEVIGKIILADGTMTAPENYEAIDPANQPAAIIIGFNDKGAMLGLGLYHKNTYWATCGNAWDDFIYFSDLTFHEERKPLQTSSSSQTTYYKYTYTGNTDGSDDWDIICAKDPEGSADPAKRYPAFDWANNYGTTYKDSLGKATDNWYIPTVSEIFYAEGHYGSKDDSLHDYTTKISATMKKISLLDPNQQYSNVADSHFLRDYTYTSNQGLVSDWVYSIDGITRLPKHGYPEYYAIAVRAF